MAPSLSQLVEHGTVLYAMPVRSGFTRDPDAPYEATNLIVAVAVCLSLATVTLGIRIYTRARITGHIAIDDYLMAAAFSLNAAMTGFILDMLNYGLGKHFWNVPLTDLYPTWMFDNFISAILFCAATGLAKGSILLFYLRIFPFTSMTWAIWSIFAFTIGYSLACVLVNIFGCNPVMGAWQLEASLTAVCINRPVFYYTQAGLGIFTDIATVLLPLPMLGSLNLPRRRKVGVAMVLTLGASVCVISVIRLWSIYRLQTGADVTVNTETALMWCVLELNLSIIGGSIPALKPFLLRVFPRIIGSTGDGRSRSGTGNAFYRHSSQAWTVLKLRPANERQVLRSKVTITSQKGSGHDGDSGIEVNIMPGHNITKTVHYGYEVEDGDDGDATTMSLTEALKQK